MAGDEPGTFRDPATGAVYMLPSSLGAFSTLGPVTREEFDHLSARVDLFSASVSVTKPDAVARMVTQVTAEGEGDGRRH